MESCTFSNKFFLFWPRILAAARSIPWCSWKVSFAHHRLFLRFACSKWLAVRRKSPQCRTSWERLWFGRVSLRKLFFSSSLLACNLRIGIDLSCGHTTATAADMLFRFLDYFRWLHCTILLSFIFWKRLLFSFLFQKLGTQVVIATELDLSTQLLCQVSFSL